MPLGNGLCEVSCQTIAVFIGWEKLRQYFLSVFLYGGSSGSASSRRFCLFSGTAAFQDCCVVRTGGSSGSASSRRFCLFSGTAAFQDCRVVRWGGFLSHCCLRVGGKRKLFNDNLCFVAICDHSALLRWRFFEIFAFCKNNRYFPGIFCP